MGPANVRSLMRDAHVLAEHALRHGQLPADSKVFKVLAAMESSPDQASEAGLVAELYREIDLLTKAISPTRFEQLVWRQSLAGYARSFVAGVMPFALGLLTLLLTFYLAFQSSQLHQADTALRAYEEWTAQQPKDKLYAAFKMYRYERVLNVKQPPLAQLDAYQKLVEEAHQLATKGAAIQSLLQNASDFQYLPPFVEDRGWTSYAKFLSDRGGLPSQAVVELKPSEGTDPNLPGSGLRPAPAEGARTDCDLEPVQPKPVKIKMKVKAEPVAEAPRPTNDIEAYASSWACFLTLIGIDEQRLSYSPWPVIFDTKSKVNLLVTWLLPGLYGLLGACVYLLRDMMKSRQGRLYVDTTVLNNLSLLLRIALGGLAGIIIGWFWVPTTAGNGVVQPISSIPFGMAFLAGFSIETLFSLLDRLNKTIENRSDAKQPEPAAAAQRSPAA